MRARNKNLDRGFHDRDRDVFHDKVEDPSRTETILVLRCTRIKCDVSIDLN